MPHRNDLAKIGLQVSKDIESILDDTAVVIYREEVRNIPRDTGLAASTIEILRLSPTSILIVAGSDEAYYVVFIEFGTENIQSRPFKREAALVGWQFMNSRFRELAQKYS